MKRFYDSSSKFATQRPHLLLTASILAPMLGLGSIPALAQTISDRQPRAAALEEVVVTARRRQESLQDVPIAITAFSEEFIRTMRSRTSASCVITLPRWLSVMQVPVSIHR